MYHSVGQNGIQIHLNQMDRSELLRNQAMLDRRMALAQAKKKSKVEMIKLYKLSLKIEFSIKFPCRKIPNTCIYAF